MTGKRRKFELEFIPNKKTKVTHVNDTALTEQPVNNFRKLEVFQIQWGQYFSQGITQNERVIVLIDKMGDFCYLHLRDDWIETSICEGNIVNVFGQFDDDNKCIIDNSQGLLIVNPDILISATSVSDSFACMRKGILSDRVNGNFTYSPALVYGNAIPIIQAWSDKFIGEIPKPIDEHLSISKVKPALCISKILDIEEHICSTTYGLKGKIDASVEVKVSENGLLKKLIMPFEIKTSRNTSPSHFAQTAFYCLMMSDYYNVNVSSGLLYYLKSQTEETGKMIKVPVVPHELRSLIIQRNKMAWFSSEKMSLPPVIKNKFQCGNCNLNTSCFLYHKACEKGTGESSGVANLFEKIVSHLQDHHLEFFNKWNELITLEEDKYRFQPEIWNMQASLINDDDMCLKNMYLEPKSIKQNGEGNRQIKCKFICQRVCVNLIFDTQFCIGDHVIISSEKENRTVANGYIEDITSNYIYVSLDRIPRCYPKRMDDFEIESCHSFIGLPEIGSSTNYSKMGITDTLYRIYKDELTSNMKLVRQNLVSLLVDEETAKLRKLIVDFKPPRFNMINEMSLNLDDMKTLNEDQITAVKLSLNAEDYAIILGMPGTGKSTTIVQIIKALVKNGKSVLLAAYTHSAVDNIIFKLIDENIDILRLGTKAKVRPDIWPFMLDIEEFDSVNKFRSFIESKQVIATTCLGINQFDYCIIDEATQVTLPICVGPLRFANKFLLVGDDFQLPPLVRDREAIEKGMGKSLFTTLIERHTQAFTKLRYQYRMHEEIMNLSNCLIYDYKMLCGTPNDPNHYLTIPKWNEDFLSQFHKYNDNHCSKECWLRKVLDPQHPVVMVDTDSLEANESRGLNQNVIEASLVEQCVKAMVVGGVHQKEIGIITPFRHQIKLLTQKFKGLTDIEISTVDKFQGREKEVIVISLVKANTDNKVSDILKDYRRLNVAITRARSKLIIFGSISTVSTSELVRHIVDHIKNSQTLYKLNDKNTPYWHVIPKIDLLSRNSESASKVNKVDKQPKNITGNPEVLLKNSQLLRDIAINLKST
ncbi:10524_t:CDS:2 [Diversispora eburnea]|uniref:DNA helicase n=1 Tax=Diversispora eburnea TaxID=1213867 RepID=A0A9N9FRF8_9GLOM|nr:10524_t:CDS:2 [Diversispora eburnea]